MRSVIVLTASLVVLSACQTKTVEEMNYSERKDLAQQIAQRCYAQGVKPGSAEYEQCSAVEVQREAAMRQRAANLQDARRASRVRATCRNFGATVTCF